jgi:hypothetical protein
LIFCLWRSAFCGEYFHPPKVYSIQFDKETSKFTLGAGETHGIAIGAEFRAYSNSDKSLEHPLGTFVVKELSPFTSGMSTTSNTLQGQQLSAIQTKVGQVERFYVYIPAEDPFRVHYHSVRASSIANLQSVFLVNRQEEAHLKVCTLPDGRIGFVHTNQRVTRHATNLVTDGTVAPAPHIVGGILDSAARYFRELNRTSAIHGIEDYIEVEFYELHVPMIRGGNRPLTNSLTPLGPNLCHDNIIDLIVDSAEIENPLHGFKIINHTERDLHVNAFYFDNSNFSIRESQ